MDPATAFNWAAYLGECASLAVDAACWVFTARAVGHAIGLVGK